MNNKAAMMAMAALLLAAGCDSGSTNSAEGANSANGGSAAPAGGSPVTQAALVGTWGQDNCTNSMTFAADGTATSTSSEQGASRWSLDGSTIVISSPGEADVRMPATMSDGELHLTGGGGEGRSAVLTRCTAERGADNAAAPGGENEAAEAAAE